MASSSVNTIIACVDDHPKIFMLLKRARNHASESGNEWGAFFVESTANASASGEKSEFIDNIQYLTRKMGGKIISVQAESYEKGLDTYLKKEAAHIPLVIVGTVIPEANHQAASAGLERIAREYTVVETVPLSAAGHPKLMQNILTQQAPPLRTLYSIAALGTACLGAWMVRSLFAVPLLQAHDEVLGLLFLIACTFVAGYFGLLAGVLASCASVFIVNYYFVAPYDVLKLSTASDLFDNGLFLFTSLLISFSASQLGKQKKCLAKKELRSQLLFALYRVAAGSFSRQQALEKLQHKLSSWLELEVAFFLPSVQNPDRIELVYPQDISLTDAERAMLEACWTEVMKSGTKPAQPSQGAWCFEPMISPSGEIGLLGIKPKPQTKMDSWFRHLLTAIADQTATILEHIQQERSQEASRISDEREKLRSMLLSSVSHDFKTPLAGIIGALSVHRSLGDRLPQHKRDELLESAMEEAQRLDSFITNILDMTRLESGNIKFNQDWHSFQATVRNVQKRLHNRLRQHELVILPSDNVEVSLDSIMTEQVLQNVLDNACKYTPAQTRIELQYRIDDTKGFVCTIRDHGGGIPKGSIDLVFDKYTRLHKKDSQVAGTGLGLAISRKVIEAQGGSITATNHEDGGAVFTIRFPKWRVAEALKTGVVL